MTEYTKIRAIPTHKVGTAFQSPSWRAEALFHPHKFGLGYLCSDIDATSPGCFKRLIGWPGLVVEVDSHPAILADCLAGLPDEQRYLYTDVTKKKSHCTISVLHKKFVSWNLRRIEQDINDDAFLAIAEHMSGYRYDGDIAFALKLGTDELQSVVAKFIGYSIFLGRSDVELFKAWKISPKRIAWFRKLFFDFSHFPKDQVSRWALLRQLTNNETFSEVDFNYFRRITDLGDLALKAQCDFNNLADEEKSKIEEYLGNTAIINVLNQHMSIRTSDDSREYARSVTDFVKLKVQKQHVKNVELSMQMTSAKLQNITNMQSDTVLPEEQLLLDDLARRSLVNAAPLQVKTIADLK